MGYFNRVNGCIAVKNFFATGGHQKHITWNELLDERIDDYITSNPTELLIPWATRYDRHYSVIQRWVNDEANKLKGTVYFLRSVFYFDLSSDLALFKAQWQ